MLLIKLTTPELIADFFAGEDSKEVNEACKVVFLDEDGEQQKAIAEDGLTLFFNGSFVSVNKPEKAEAPVAKKKPTKKK